MSDESTTGEKALFLVLGAAIGAIAALLFAPRSGEETRQLIASKAREGADTVTAQTKSVKEKTSGYLDRGKDMVQQQRDSLNAALEAGKKAYREEKDKA
ncbi:MAG: YtxH domain-containing protein [Acidobacteriota bacterium]